MSDPGSLIVDLHIHSHYSRATSEEMNIASLYKWGKIKGINVIGTGDFTHPMWLHELKTKLEPAEPGLFKLKAKYAQEQQNSIPASCRQNPIRFILTAEISNIYSKHGKVRKLHHVVIVPNFATAEKLNFQLSKIGNLRADGRPILGMDSKDLLRMTIEVDDHALFIPAHVWTPWFGLFGSKSGFDSIEEAFEELTPHIHALETGLSSDPFMNWRWSDLKNITLVSHSDAHSPRNLGREANILQSNLNYFEIIDAIKTGDDRFVGTIEFYPQEGKYHWDGHRNCNVVLSPQETKKHKGICPACGKALTVGVDYRVSELSDHPHDYKPAKHKKVEYIVPLTEMLKEIHQVKTVTSKTVIQAYEQAIQRFGNEFDLLRSVPIKDIKENHEPQLAEAINRMRKGQVKIEPGYDGVYGQVKLFEAGELENFAGQQVSLF